MPRKTFLLRVLVAGLSLPLEAEDREPYYSEVSQDPVSARGLGLMLELAACATSCSKRLVASERFLFTPLECLCMRSRDPRTNPLPAAWPVVRGCVNPLLHFVFHRSPFRSPFHLRTYRSLHSG